MKKTVFLLLLSIAFFQLSFTQETKYQLSTHILDITAGLPAQNVTITLAKKDNNGNWVKLDEKKTDKNGRVGDFLKQDGFDNTGIYKLTFHTSEYFNEKNDKTFYPYIEVVFELSDDQHYHVPITLSPYGYSTYRGS